MCLFVETIRIDNGKACRLELHQERMERTRRMFWSGLPDIMLADYLRDLPDAGIFKCRVLYGERIEAVECTPYRIRPVRTLQAVYADEVDYACKRADRSELNRLFEGRAGSDDVLIVRKGLLTDTSIANVALYDGTGWYTPAAPLLAGTCRADLLRRGVLRERNMAVDDLYTYSEIRLFNAMIGFGDLRIPVDRQHVRL